MRAFMTRMIFMFSPDVSGSAKLQYVPSCRNDALLFDEGSDAHHPTTIIIGASRPNRHRDN